MHVTVYLMKMFSASLHMFMSFGAILKGNKQTEGRFTPLLLLLQFQLLNPNVNSSSIVEHLLFLPDPILNGSQRSSPPTSLYPTPPIIPASRTSRHSLGTQQLRGQETGKLTEDLCHSLLSSKSQAAVSPLVLQQKPSCSPPNVSCVSYRPPLLASLLLCLTLSQSPTPSTHTLLTQGPLLPGNKQDGGTLEIQPRQVFMHARQAYYF